MIGKDDQHQGGGYQLRDGARGGDHAGGQLHVVAVAHHHRQRDQAHGDHRGGDGSRDGAKNGPDDNDRIGKSATHRSEQLPHALQHVFGEAAALQYGAHESEKWDGEEQFVGEDAEHALGQRLQQRHREETEFDAEKSEEQSDGGE